MRSKPMPSSPFSSSPLSRQGLKTVGQGTAGADLLPLGCSCPPDSALFLVGFASSHSLSPHSPGGVSKSKVVGRAALSIEGDMAPSPGPATPVPDGEGNSSGDIPPGKAASSPPVLFSLSRTGTGGGPGLGP
ncbi:hypothetical protein AAFF_G00434710 [Aldrovandia affinis]|uniref:Uncharacterized protein n=1 Tax=Aldrovandia affinis TaxID=143900 RepID=A0AAD7WI41_9TELE|nr:hypothetical protein AAFF_G00434710 [Aldrovandia affinis]